MTRPRGRPGSGPLSVSARSWLVRQACGEKVVSCRRKQDSHAREVHEAVTASGARLHSVEVGGFYRRHADGRFDFTELAALQAADLANRLDDLRLLSRARLTAAQVRRAEDLLPEAVAARGDGRAVLCHGDLRPDHIFVATGENAAVTVAGLIDFGDACGGRPLDDMAMLCRNWPDVDRAALAAGYGPAAFWDEGGRRLALGQLRLLIGFAAYDLRTGNPAEARDLADLRVLLAGKLRNSVFSELPQVTCGLIVDELCKSRWITVMTCG